MSKLILSYRMPWGICNPKNAILILINMYSSWHLSLITRLEVSSKKYTWHGMLLFLFTRTHTGPQRYGKWICYLFDLLVSLYCVLIRKVFSCIFSGFTGFFLLDVTMTEVSRYSWKQIPRTFPHVGDTLCHWHAHLSWLVYSLPVYTVDCTSMLLTGTCIICQPPGLSESRVLTQIFKQGSITSPKMSNKPNPIETVKNCPTKWGAKNVNFSHWKQNPNIVIWDGDSQSTRYM